ncbi:hypothetical protein [Jiella sonneratiae]|uniref:Capsule biosynthesis protein n=1 Tax=Jiella sonneratiae TaxID=2816856 RepID=A0ABS3J4F9_9HYPH|nr:hypothetical protein [Jiella sonneratiae]MBO0904561.1 hypothetical protein [Jiella sonneratiae]
MSTDVKNSLVPHPGRTETTHVKRSEPRLEPTDGNRAGRAPTVAPPVAAHLPAGYQAPRPLAEPRPRLPETETWELTPEAAGTIRRLDEVAVKPAGGRERPWLFLVCVVLPTLVAGTYLLAFAPDLYTAEASYILRKGGAALTVGSVIPGLGRSDDSSEAIVVYFQSRDAAEHLAADEKLKAALMPDTSSSFFSGLPGLSENTRETFYRAMLDSVDVSIDTDTGISTLAVTASSAADAKMLNEALLDEAENLVNRLNARAVKDTISFAETVVSENEDRVRDVQKRMTAFRNSESILDPGAQSTGQIDLMTQLTQQVTSIDTQIAQLTASAPKNPRLASLKAQRKALENQIAEVRQGLAGDDTSLAGKLSAYQNLDLERTLAIQALTNAYASLEQAREEAFTSRLYLQTIAAPNLPEKPSYPRPILWTAIVAAIGFAVYTTARTMGKDTMEHSA